jgi:tRNA (guanine-N7-)-methyltransferase
MVGIGSKERSIIDLNESTRTPCRPDEFFRKGPWTVEDLFEEPAPLEVEFGTGKARFLLESARAHPERNYLGLERSLAYYRVSRGRVDRSGLANVRIVRADAGEFVESAPDRVAVAYHAYFLDPWPKLRQRKRRLISAPFLRALWPKTAPGGLVRIVTDHADYADAIAAAVTEARDRAPWQRLDWAGAESPPPTNYELKYRAAGRPFHRFLLRRGSDELSPTPTGGRARTA